MLSGGVLVGEGAGTAVNEVLLSQYEVSFGHEVASL